jgi:hypothetical protein
MSQSDVNSVSVDGDSPNIIIRLLGGMYKLINEISVAQHSLLPNSSMTTDELYELAFESPIQPSGFINNGVEVDVNGVPLSTPNSPDCTFLLPIHCYQPINNSLHFIDNGVEVDANGVPLSTPNSPDHTSLSPFQYQPVFSPLRFIDNGVEVGHHLIPDNDDDDDNDPSFEYPLFSSDDKSEHHLIPDNDDDDDDKHHLIRDNDDHDNDNFDSSFSPENDLEEDGPLLSEHSPTPRVINVCVPKREETYNYRDDALSAINVMWVEAFHQGFMTLHFLHTNLLIAMCTAISSWHPAGDLLLCKDRLLKLLYAYFIFDKLLLAETFYAEAVFQHLAIKRDDREKYQHAPKRKRTINLLTDKEAYRWTRFMKAHLHNLYHNWKVPDTIRTKNCRKFGGEEVMLICLTWIARGTDW